ncbi:hypothetical protein SAMN02745131_00895 [Flavisolibacter ginsengisoli DSM 18119]|jgi:hypothetical protein|uniref:Uncharacterized protein n=1 Tax=Flavisolibacter ginsengisoli DSM 18119 TaxID=1121884 RepID=A0A1M4VLM7_9BACT|nr:hypothetical protein SAMN02745131_00895 [Flavisolibacter ginsengisoli DSM 18119]
MNILLNTAIMQISLVKENVKANNVYLESYLFKFLLLFLSQ